MLDVQDVQVVLAKHWGIVVPGLGMPNIRPLKPGKNIVSRTPNGSLTGGPGGGGHKRKASSDHGASVASRKKSTASSAGSAEMAASVN